MESWGWLAAGGVAATGAVAAFWGQLRSLWAYLVSIIVVSCDVHLRLEEAISFYCWRRLRTVSLGPRTYLGIRIFVRPRRRHQVVAYEAMGSAGKLYWKGWRPLWVSQGALPDNAPPVGGAYTKAKLRISYLRGTFQADRLILDALDEYNRWRAEVSSAERYAIHQVFGTAGKPMALPPPGVPGWASGPPAPEDDAWAHRNRLLAWRPEELGEARGSHGEALERLALCPAAEALVAEARRWRQSEGWYRQRGIPWRRSYLLFGPPGAGKTSLARALAEDLNLPVFVYNLATLYNDELRRHWEDMLTAVPCMAMVEDIDAVFDGRETAVGQLTFDGLLNCLDGVSRADGVLLVITTNHPERLDKALTRPGRLDRLVELGPLDEAGRRKLCRRILPEHPELWDGLVAAGDGETGAAFQERCTRQALACYWKDNGRASAEEPCLAAPRPW